jgi:DNA-binding Xre family transcriptional regulator
MAIKLQIQDVARKLGIENAAQLSKLTGIGLTSCYQLWEGKAKMISFKTLNTICNTLKVHPVLLLDYKPDPEGRSSITIKSKKGRRAD